MSRLRFLAVWLACAALLAGASAGAILAVYAVLDPGGREQFARLLESGSNILFVFGVALVVAAGFLADGLVRVWVAPVRRLSESTRLVAGGNPAHRAEPRGPAEVREAAAAVNALAERYEALSGNVEARIRQARADLDDEKSRLAALMSELASSVVVCTVDGRILLYNEHARRLFSGSEVPGYIGLGRSLFSLLDRSLIAHALDQLRERLAKGEAKPVSVFLASPGPSLWVTPTRASKPISLISDTVTPSTVTDAEPTRCTTARMCGILPPSRGRSPPGSVSSTRRLWVRARRRVA